MQQGSAWGKKVTARLPRTLAAALAVVLALAGLEALPLSGVFLERMEWWSRDTRCRTFARPPRTFNTAVVAVDEASFKTFRENPDPALKALRWPWPPTLLGKAAKVLIEDGGAELVVFDISFSEPYSGLYKPAYTDLSALAAHPENTLFGSVYDRVPGGPGRGGWVDPQPGLTASGAGVASANLVLDPDGAVRAVHLTQRGRPSFALAAAGRLAMGPDAWRLPPEEIAKTLDLPRGRHEIVFYGGPGTIPTTSFADVVVPERRAALGGEDGLRERFAGKAVFVGVTVKDLHDLHRTAVHPALPGVEIHASVTENLLNQDRYRVLPLPGWLLGLAAAFAVALAAGLIGPVGGFFSALALVAVYLAATLVHMRSGGWLWPWTMPVAAMVFTALVSTVWLARKEQRDRDKVKRMFGRFVSPSVVTHLVEHEDEDVLTGRTLPLTVLFSDIAGFTTLSESMDPDRLFTFLSEYLGAMTEEVLATGGTLDKYIGDAVMAFWGAPIRLENPERRAVQTALAMQTRLAGLNARWSTEGLPAIRARIGVATGHAAVGALGSELRVDYTVLGDTVNFASRLEGANKHFKTSILICGATRAGLGEDVSLRDLGEVVVVGKAQPVSVFQVLPEGDGPGEERVGAFEAARQLLTAGRFADAAVAFEEISLSRPDDGTPAVFLDIARRLAASPPDRWSGAVELSGK